MSCDTVEVVQKRPPSARYVITINLANKVENTFLCALWRANGLNKLFYLVKINSPAFRISISATTRHVAFIPLASDLDPK